MAPPTRAIISFRSALGSDAIRALSSTASGAVPAGPGGPPGPGPPAAPPTGNPATPAPPRGGGAGPAPPAGGSIIRGGGGKKTTDPLEAGPGAQVAGSPASAGWREEVRCLTE